MKTKQMILAYLLIGVLLSNALAAPIKGIQAILLHRWSPTSAAKLAEVVSTYSGTEFEISFAPNVAATASDPYKNIRDIIDNIKAANSAIVVTAVVYGNFHANDGTVNNLDKFVAFFKAYKNKAQIVICPSLEDYATQSEINVAAKNIATAIKNAGEIQNLGKLILRRSPDKTNTDKRKPSRTVVIGTTGYTYKKVELELHGVVSDANGADVYSNDGVYVYDPLMILFDSNNESSSSFSSIGTSTKYSLTSFRQLTTGIRTNLWRPAYNMYRGCGGNYMSRADRNFKDCNNHAFDDEEANVLKRFLN